MTLPAQVIRQDELNGTANPLLLTSIRFEDITPRDEYHLGRLVADLQNNLIRRMLRRARHSAPESVRRPSTAAPRPERITPMREINYPVSATAGFPASAASAPNAHSPKASTSARANKPAAVRKA